MTCSLERAFSPAHGRSATFCMPGSSPGGRSACLAESSVFMGTYVTLRNVDACGACACEGICRLLPYDRFKPRQSTIGRVPSLGRFITTRYSMPRGRNGLIAMMVWVVYFLSPETPLLTLDEEVEVQLQAPALRELLDTVEETELYGRSWKS